MTQISTDVYFSTATPPSNLTEISLLVESFILKNNSRKVVLVTSGGTTVPLEKNTVRFLDNFSAGTRGAASAEAFIEQGIYFAIYERMRRYFLTSTILSRTLYKTIYSFQKLLPGFY
jgi:phosphopantothenate-cysteine ligase